MFDYTINQITNSGLITISKDGESIVFRMGTSVTKNEGVFEYLNQYLDTQPVLSTKIFGIYKEIRNLLDTSFVSPTINSDLETLCIELVDSFSIESVETFIVFKSSIILPPHFEVNYVEDPDSNTTRDQTYLREDYLRLVAVSIILRSMLPIWSEFIGTIKNDAGSLFKEQYAANLIRGTKLYQDHAIERLKTYIEKTANGGHIDNPTLTLAGISTEDFLDWMLAIVLVRRITTGDISGYEPKINLVTSVYSYVSQKVNSENSSREFKKKVSDTNAVSEMDSKLSVLERYKIKSDMSIGSNLELERALSDYVSNAYRLAPNIDRRLLDDAVNTSHQLLDARISPSAVTVLSILYSGIVPGKSVRYINRNLLVKCLATAQAVLYSRGHYFLSIMVTSKVDTSNDIIITGVESRNRIPQETIDELNKYFPYQRKESSRRKVKEKNLAITSIDELAAEISSVNMITTASREFMVAANNTRTNMLVVPSDLKIKLANFVLDVVKLKEQNN
jgi:hypothetical protein